MNNRERLTALVHSMQDMNLISVSGDVDKVVDYLIDQEVLVVPCKLGQRIYEVISKQARVRKGGCGSCTCSPGYDVGCHYYKDNRCTSSVSSYYSVISRRFELSDVDAFGVTVFADPHKAEDMKLRFNMACFTKENGGV